jgi:hypothetical protein
MPTQVNEFVARCQASGIDPVLFLQKVANKMGGAECTPDDAVVCAGKNSEIPAVHSAAPLPKTTLEEDKEHAAPDENRPVKQTKDAFIQQATTLTMALAQLKEAGLIRPDLLKVACDALEVLPDFRSMGTAEAVIAAANAEDNPDVAMKLRKSASDMYAGLVMRVVEKLTPEYYVGD